MTSHKKARSLSSVSIISAVQALQKRIDMETRSKRLKSRIKITPCYCAKCTDLKGEAVINVNGREDVVKAQVKIFDNAFGILTFIFERARSNKRRNLLFWLEASNRIKFL